MMLDECPSDAKSYRSKRDHSTRLMRTRTYYLKRQPARGTLVRYDDRVAEVLGGARGNRVMIRSVHVDGTTRITAVKWRNLAALGASLFE